MADDTERADSGVSIPEAVVDQNQSDTMDLENTIPESSQAIGCEIVLDDVTEKVEVPADQEQLNICAGPYNPEPEPKNRFWETQPVVQVTEKVTTNEAIEPEKAFNEIRGEPYYLPAGCEWASINIENARDLRQLYDLFDEHYVNENVSDFGLACSARFLRWILGVPGSRPELLLGIRNTASGKLIGFISGVPKTFQFFGNIKEMLNVNLLCIHKEIRSRKITQILIKELTRRAHLDGIFQGIFCEADLAAKPFARCRIYHRLLNPRAVLLSGFMEAAPDTSLYNLVKAHKIPNHLPTVGFRKIKPSDVPQAFELLTNYLKKFVIAPIFTLQSFRHLFLCQPDVVESFVVEIKGQITDFVSYYNLSIVMALHPTRKKLKVAHLFYSVATATPWPELITCALITAQLRNYDMFNALDVMDNHLFLDPCMFMKGTSQINFYLYNWRCPRILRTNLGIISF